MASTCTEFQLDVNGCDLYEKKKTHQIYLAYHDYNRVLDRKDRKWCLKGEWVKCLTHSRIRIPPGGIYESLKNLCGFKTNSVKSLKYMY